MGATCGFRPSSATETKNLIELAAPPIDIADSLYPYQREAVSKLVALGGKGGLFLDMGTGKTRVALAVAQQLNCSKILVVCPLSAGGVWTTELRKLRLDLNTANLRSGSIKDRSSRLRMFGPGLAVVNYEAYWREPLRSQIVRWAPDAVIYDEAHKLKNRGTRQSRFAHSLVHKIKHILALTGTPIGQGLEDLFSVFKAVNPEVFGFRWADFEARYLIKGGYLGYQTVGYKNQAEMESKLARFSYRKKKEDILDLPPKQDVIISVPLEEKSRKTYEEMRKLAITQVQGTDPETGLPISGVALSRVVLTNILRLQQIASGFVKMKDGSVVDLSHEKDTYLSDLLEDILEQKEKAVIFCRFKNEIRRVTEIAKRLTNHQMTLLDGSVEQRERENRIRRFADGEARCIVVQIAVGSLGIDLSSCSKAIFYGLTHSTTEYLQAEDRLHRHGQQNFVTYYLLLGEKTIDETIYKALKRHENLAKGTLDRAEALRLFA